MRKSRHLNRCISKVSVPCLILGFDNALWSSENRNQPGGQSLLLEEHYSSSLDQESLWLESGVTSTWMQPQNRVGDQEGLVRILQEGGEISPAFAIPWFSLSSLRLDWLHVADQGVTPVFLGGLFHHFLSSRENGPNEDARCAEHSVERHTRLLCQRGHSR